MARTETTVFELAGEDQPGLLSETTRLLTANGCNVRSAAVGSQSARLQRVSSQDQLLRQLSALVC